MIGVKQKGDFKHLESFLQRVKKEEIYSKLEKYGMIGAALLAAATPIDTGKTASSWNYEIDHSDGYVKLYWTNSNLTDTGIPIAILIQYGHATGNGGYVQGRDYINPTLRPVFDDIVKNVWNEVCKL